MLRPFFCPRNRFGPGWQSGTRNWPKRPSESDFDSGAGFPLQPDKANSKGRMQEYAVLICDLWRDRAGYQGFGYCSAYNIPGPGKIGLLDQRQMI